MSRKKSLPGWFPFALMASGLVAIAAGMRSKGKLSGETEPAVKQGGVLQDWAGVRLG